MGLDDKRVIKRLIRNPVCEENFRSEANILKSLKHKGIPVIYDIEEDGEAYYIIEEYIEGLNICEYVNRYGTIKEETAVRFGIQICEIMTYLHKVKPAGVLYLDLKPQNVIVNEGNIYVVDFGNSVFCNEKRKYMSGTAGYAAPEQYKFQNIGVHTDIYGIGALLYYMVTGQICKTGEKLFINHNLLISEKFKKIITQCMSSDVEKRYKDAASVADSLYEIIHKKRINDKEKINEKALKGESLNISGIGLAGRLRRTKGIKGGEGRGYLNSLQQKNGVRIIGIAGSFVGSGVTTMCIAMANYLAEIRSVKVAVVEMNNSGEFESLCRICDSRLLEDNSYKIGKVTYFYGAGFLDISGKLCGKYEYVILDFGNALERCILGNISLNHKILMGSTLFHKLEYHMNAAQCIRETGLAGEWLHILSGDDKSVKEYSAEEKINALVRPYIANPYIIESETANFFQLLF